MTSTLATVQRGAIAIPSDLLARLQIADGDSVWVFQSANGIMIQRTPPDLIEEYTPERVRELLNGTSTTVE